MAKLEVGQRIQTTTVEEVLPAAGSAGKDKRPPFFEYIDNLTAEEWATHDLHVYRSSNGTADRSSFQSLVKYLGEPLDGFILRQRLGGGVYKFLLKNNGVIIKNETVKFEGAPKDPTLTDPARPNPASANGSAPPVTNLGEVKQIVELVISQLRGGPTSEQAFQGALSLQTEGLKSGLTAAQGVLQTMAGGTAARSRSDEFMDKLTMMMMERMMNPPDPIAHVVAMIGALKTAGLAGNGGGGGDKMNLGLEIVKQVPTVMSHVSDAVANYLRATEIQAQTQLAIAGKPPVAPPPPRNVTPPPQPAPAAAHPAATPAGSPSPAANAAGPATGRDPMIDVIENGIVNIMQKMAQEPVADMANEVITFLDGFRGVNLVDMLAKLGEEKLLQLFVESPVLREIPNDQRLKEFIRMFLRQAGEGVEVIPPPKIPQVPGNKAPN